jgi:hypothetical protein
VAALNLAKIAVALEVKVGEHFPAMDRFPGLLAK